jgi:hypothetical protein
MACALTAGTPCAVRPRAMAVGSSLARPVIIAVTTRYPSIIHNS